MRTTVKAAILLVALILIFLLVPVFPYTAASSSAFGVATVKVTADVSLTYLLFHCGSFINAQVTGSIGGFAGARPISQGYTIKFNPRSSSLTEYNSASSQHLLDPHT